MDGRKLAQGLDVGLLRRLKRVRTFVGALREMLQREFFPAPYVLRHWSDSKLTLLGSALDHVQALAYVCANSANIVTIKRADQVYLSWASKSVRKVSDDDHGWREASSAMSNELSRLLSATHENASKYSLNVSTRVVPEVAIQLRLIQENVDDIYRVLEIWTELLENRIVQSPVKEVRVRFLPLESTSRNLWSTLLDAERVVKRGQDLLNICIHTRMATAAGLHALALDFDRTESISDVYARLEQLHDDALVTCQKLLQAEDAPDNPLFVQARESIEWRKNKLLSHQNGYLRDLRQETSHSGISQVVTSLTAGIEWTTSPAWIEWNLKGCAADVREFTRALNSQSTKKERAPQLESPRIVMAKVQLVRDTKRNVSWSAKRKQITVCENVRDVDVHWLGAVKSVAIRCLAGQADDNLDEDLKQEIKLRRLRAIRSLAISNVRIMSSKGLDSHNWDLVSELERYNNWVVCSEIESDPENGSLPQGSWRIFQGDTIPGIDAFTAVRNVTESRNLAVARLATCQFTTKKHKSLIALRSVEPLSLVWRAKLPADYVALLTRHGLTRDTLLAQLADQFSKSAEPSAQVRGKRPGLSRTGTTKLGLSSKPRVSKPHMAKFRSGSAISKPATSGRASGQKS